ncbi:MAG: glycerol-3-phosphate dehydrogenase/oxidase [Nevskia sp.]|nr:glycerol-3-phosphate dehydrogenase/oxidase [Nevskia sp.]
MPAAFPLVRDVRALRERRFDVLVIGGGIYGAWIAYDAALRGLSVALIEKRDWAAGTSSRSSKLIHGGLRYLEHFEFRLVRHALAERRLLARLAPHLVRPLDFVVPVWRDSRVGRLQLLAGLTLYDFLATGKQPVPRFKSLSRRRLLAAHPYLESDGLRGGLRYGDCQEDDARMVLFVVAAAQSAGAVCANNLEALELLERAGEVCGARVRDTETGARFALHAACTVNAAGPWARELLRPASNPLPRITLIRGVHLVLPAIPGCSEAFTLIAPQDGRAFFVVPWYGRSLVGTTERAVATPDESPPTAEETRYLLHAVAARLPGLRWRAADVIASFAGVRALQDEAAAELSAVSREFVLHEPRPRLLWPLGGKYTTARCDAVQVVDHILAALGRAALPTRTDRQPLPGAPHEVAALGDFTGWQAEAVAGLQRRGVDPEAAHWLSLRHGTRVARIHALLDENPRWAARLHPQAPILAAEVVLAAREEMARIPEDVLRRRTPLQLLVPADGRLPERIAELMSAA